MTIKESRAYKYAKWCTVPDNHYAPKYVKKQAARWVDIVDGKNKNAYVCEKMFNKVCKLLRIIIHPDLHKPLYDCAEDYAWLLIVAVFCTKTTDGYRFYQTALLEICRKNFKTFYSAVIFIIGMLIDGKFGRYFSVAPDLKLSKELQNALKKIIKSSPMLSADGVFKAMRNETRCILTDSEFTPLAYSEDKMDGKLANIFLADEAGAMDAYPVEAMRSSQITLRDKLGIIISTQYPNENNVLLDEIDYAKNVLDGLIDDERYFSLLYEPDDEYKNGDKWQTEDNIIYQSNPVALVYDYIFEDLIKKRKRAILYESARENFLCKHCNIRYKSLGVEGYIEITKVRECRIKEDLTFWKGKKVWLGLDLSLSCDNTAVAMVTEENGNVYAKVWGFIPSEKVELKSEKEHTDYKRLISDKVCFDCGDEVIDYGFIERFILNLSDSYDVEIMQVGYDRWNAISTAQKLEDEQLECVEIKQHSSLLHRPTKWLEELVLSRNFFYDENLLLEINFENARCTTDTNLNKYVNKKKSNAKVDCVVALLNALFLLQLEVENPENFGAQII